MELTFAILLVIFGLALMVLGCIGIMLIRFSPNGG